MTQFDILELENYYTNNDNYFTKNEKTDNSLVCIYFSSNGIYFPNTDEEFKKKIIETNYYDWYKTRIKKATKHIYVRDIKKTWYINGINKSINSPEKLFELLKNETKGFDEIVTLGSSAGGYAACLYGALLGANRVFAISPQFNLKDMIINESDKISNPVLAEKIESGNFEKYLNIIPFIKDAKKTDFFYFYPGSCDIDVTQSNYVKNISNIYTYCFNSSSHSGTMHTRDIIEVINFNSIILKKLFKKFNLLTIERNDFSTEIRRYMPLNTKLKFLLIHFLVQSKKMVKKVFKQK